MICINCITVTNPLFVSSFDVIHSRVVCTFLTNSQHLKSCSLTYGEEDPCNDYSQTSWSTSNVVTIGLPTLTQSLYCYTLTASNGTYTVITKGTFVTGTIINIPVYLCMQTTLCFILSFRIY